MFDSKSKRQKAQPESISLADYAIHRAQELSSLYMGTKTHFRQLWCFMDVNHWFGYVHGSQGIETVVFDLPVPFPRLDLWLRAFERTEAEKYTCLVSTMKITYPSLIQQWTDYCHANPNITDTHRLICLDYLLSVTDTDSPDWTRERLEHTCANMAAVLPRIDANYILDFCQAHLLLQTPEYSVTYQLLPSGVTHPTPALSFEHYARLAWFVFDETAVEQGQYVKKATHSRREAELWLFVALHFLSALRIPDMRLLPIPHISDSGSALRYRIMSGTFSIKECTELVNEWLFRIEMEGRTPTKTTGVSGINSVMVNIPTSLFPMFGKILALVVSYHEEGQPLILTHYVTGKSLDSFFGSEFNRLCGGQYFLSTRQLNKAYLQGAEYIAEHTPGIHVRGYLLASILRSHKHLPGILPQTTDAYLGDQDFAGIQPYVVAREMFERGVFGFIPCILLSHYTQQWHTMNLHEQTNIIQALELSPCQLEHVTETLEQAREKVQTMLSKLFQQAAQSCKNSQDHVSVLHMCIDQLLNNLALGYAPAKNPCNLCLRSAAGLPCIDVSRSSCLGCGYELWTRSGIHLLLEQYERNLHAMKDAGRIERMRLEKLNSRCLLPTLESILRSMRLLYADEPAAQGFIEMVQWRFEHAKD